jgi:putative membrane protein
MRIKLLNRLAVTLAGSLLLLWASAGAAQQINMSAEGNQTPGSPEMQAEVLTKMHLINQFEIKAGKLAEEKGSTYKVRAYGDRLHRDHTMADNKVMDFAKLYKIQFVTSPEMSNLEQTHEEMVSNLASLSGLDFDRKFLELMNQGHKQAIGMLGVARLQLPSSAPLHRLISMVIPILEQHDTIANQLQLKELAQGQQ